MTIQPPFPPEGQYVAEQDPPGMSIPFRVEGDNLYWGDPPEHYLWDDSGAWVRWDPDKRIYIYEPDGYVAHDHSTSPPTPTGGTWGAAP